MSLRVRTPRTAEGSQARVVRNTLANTGGTLVTVGVGLALSPFMIHKLGVDAYGVWILATTLTFGVGYLSFADFGIEQAAVRYIAEARAAGDEDEMNRIWLTAFTLLAGVALLLVPPLVLLAGPLVNLFAVPASLHDEAQVAFAFVIAQLVFELPSRAFAAVLEGPQRYGLWQVARIFQTLLLSGLVVAVLLAGKGIGWLGIATFTGNGATFVLLAVLALTQMPGVRISPRLFSRRVARKLGSYGGQLLAFRILSAIYRPMDTVVIGIALTSSAVTTYEVGNKLYLGIVMIQTLATSALVPTSAFSRDEPGRLRELLLRGSSYALALAMPFLIAVFIFAGPLIRTWIGPELLDAVTPSRLLLLALVPSFAIVVGQTMLVALGVLRQMIWMVAGWTALNLALSIWLVGPLGINGPIIATLVSTVVLFFPVTWLFLREIGVGVREWTREVFLPVLPSVVVQAGVGILLLPTANGTGSLLLVSALCAITIIAAIATWMLVGLSTHRRRHLFQLLRETLGLQPSVPMAGTGLAGDAPLPTDVSVRE